jgi:hypothetical protein
MTYARKQLPQYCHHKPTDRAYVRIDRKMIYLGKHGSATSRREYDRIIAEFIANGRQAFADPDEILVEQLIIRFDESVVVLEIPIPILTAPVQPECRTFWFDHLR